MSQGNNPYDGKDSKGKGVSRYIDLPEMKKQLPGLLVGSFLTLITGTILFWWQSSKAELRWTAVEVQPFESDTNSMAIYVVKLWNEGSEEAEQLECTVDIGGSTIDNYRIEPKRLSEHLRSDGKTLTLKLDYLNYEEPEPIQLQFVGVSPDQVQTKPNVSLRAKGAVGREVITSSKDGSKMFPHIESMPLFVFTCLIFTGLSFTLYVIFDSKTTIDKRNKRISHYEISLKKMREGVKGYQEIIAEYRTAVEDYKNREEFYKKLHEESITSMKEATRDIEAERHDIKAQLAESQKTIEELKRSLSKRRRPKKTKESPVKPQGEDGSPADQGNS